MLYRRRDHTPSSTIPILHEQRCFNWFVARKTMVEGIGILFRTASGSINSPPVLYIPTVRNTEFIELSVPLIRPLLVLQIYICEPT